MSKENRFDLANYAICTEKTSILSKNGTNQKATSVNLVSLYSVSTVFHVVLSTNNITFELFYIVCSTSIK